MDNNTAITTAEQGIALNRYKQEVLAKTYQSGLLLGQVVGANQQSSVAVKMAEWFSVKKLQELRDSKAYLVLDGCQLPDGSTATVCSFEDFLEQFTPLSVRSFYYKNKIINKLQLGFLEAVVNIGFSQKDMLLLTKQDDQKIKDISTRVIEAADDQESIKAIITEQTADFKLKIELAKQEQEHLKQDLAAKAIQEQGLQTELEQERNKRQVANKQLAKYQTTGTKDIDKLSYDILTQSSKIGNDIRLATLDMKTLYDKLKAMDGKPDKPVAKTPEEYDQKIWTTYIDDIADAADIFLHHYDFISQVCGGDRTQSQIDDE